MNCTMARCSALSSRTTRSRHASVACRASMHDRSLLQRAGVAVVTTAAAFSAVLPAWAGGVSFTAPSANASVSTPVHVAFEVHGMSVRPAKDGPVPGTGHFHIFIDEGSAAKGVALPFDDFHLHYGKGQLEADVALTPGPHILTLQFADANHVSYGPTYSSSIEVNVE